MKSRTKRAIASIACATLGCAALGGSPLAADLSSTASWASAGTQAVPALRLNASLSASDGQVQVLGKQQQGLRLDPSKPVVLPATVPAGCGPSCLNHGHGKRAFAADAA